MYSKRAHLIACLLLCLTTSPSLAQRASGFLVVAGNARDLTGAPIGGVMVEVVRGIGLPTATGSDGFYLIAVVETDDQNVVLRFSKNGFMRTLETLPRAGNEARLIQHDSVLKLAGDIQNVDLNAPAAVMEGSTMLTLEPGDLVGANGVVLNGSATVSITPIDPSGSEIDLFPGFDATAGGNDSLLESFAAADIIIRAAGQAAQVAPGKTLSVEFPIPDAQLSQFSVGQVLTEFLWSLNETTGRWEGGLTVTVGISSMNPAKLAFFAEIPHLSTWNCDRPLITTCLKGTVVEKATGSPLAGASVLVRGVDFNGESQAVSDSQGRFCLPTKRGSRVKLTVRAAGLAPVTTTIDLPNTTTTCSQGGCHDVGNIEIDGLGRTSCVSGTVFSSLGIAPIPPALVISDKLNSAQTDAAGRFCMNTPPDTDLKLTVIQFDLLAGAPTMTDINVHSPVGPAQCGTSGCAEIQVGEPAAPGSINCGACGTGMTLTITGSLFALFAMRRQTRR